MLLYCQNQYRGIMYFTMYLNYSRWDSYGFPGRIPLYSCSKLSVILSCRIPENIFFVCTPLSVLFGRIVLDIVWKVLCTGRNHAFTHACVCKDTHLRVISMIDVLKMTFFLYPQQGASAKWWNHMHYQHHAKPNVVSTDLYVHLSISFLFIMFSFSHTSYSLTFWLGSVFSLILSFSSDWRCKGHRFNPPA